jgi:hypothetical protein
MLQYIGDLKRKWEELNQFRAPTTDPAIIQGREQELLFQFLTELDELYEHMRAQILFSSELPTLEDAMARFQSEESRRELMSGAPPIQEKAEHTAMVSNQSELTTLATPQVEPVAMAVNGPNHRNKGKVKGSYTKVVKCDHCKKEGHDKGGCWFLHPELRLNWWVEFDEQSKKGIHPTYYL